MLRYPNLYTNDSRLAQKVASESSTKPASAGLRHIGRGQTQAELKKHKLQILTNPFGVKADCDELAPFGDVV